MQGLLLRFDAETGRRPAGIDLRDPNLRCYGWQNLEMRPALEIRLIEDDRDVSQYEGRETEGLIMLHNDAEIDTAIEKYIPSRIWVDNQILLTMDLEQRKINIANIAGDTSDKVLENLKAQGIKGMRERKPLKMADIKKV